jgi:hypothetical protein
MSESVQEYFTDGRRVAFLIERRIAREENFKLAPSEGAAFDPVDASGRMGGPKHHVGRNPGTLGKLRIISRDSRATT